MDGLFEYRLNLGLPATLINWGPWSEIGEAARKSTGSRMDLRGVGVVAPSVGSESLKHLLAMTDLRLAVAPLSVESMQPRLKKLRFFDLLRNPNRIKNTVEVSLASQLLQIPQSDQDSWVIDKVTQTLAKILGIENKLEVSSHTSFVDLGLDSLTGIEFIDSLNRQWSTKLPTSAIYDYPNISKITMKMLSQLNQLQPEIPTADRARSENESGINFQSNQIDQGAHDFDDGIAKLMTELEQWK
jgi:microcystin synthetase protein McyD